MQGKNEKKFLYVRQMDELVTDSNLENLMKMDDDSDWL